MAIVGWLAYAVTLYVFAQNQVGPDATPEQIDEALSKLMVSGQTPMIPPVAVFILLLGAICSLSGLVLAVRSLLRSQERRGMAITACIISACFLVCQILPMLAALAAQQAAQAP